MQVRREGYSHGTAATVKPLSAVCKPPKHCCRTKKPLGGNNVALYHAKTVQEPFVERDRSLKALTRPPYFPRLQSDWVSKGNVPASLIHRGPGLHPTDLPNSWCQMLPDTFRGPVFMSWHVRAVPLVLWNEHNTQYQAGVFNAMWVHVQCLFFCPLYFSLTDCFIIHPFFADLLTKPKPLIHCCHYPDVMRVPTNEASRRPARHVYQTREGFFFFFWLPPIFLSALF